MGSLLNTNSAAEAAFKIGATNPVLAKLYMSHGIRAEAIANLDDINRRSLCEDVTRLIETAERQTDREMATDILISLLRHAETQLKQALAERMSVLDNAPLRLILQFINEEIDVARPVLTHSKALNDLDLLYIIQSRDSPFWQAIAARQDLGENVVETLVDTKDVMTAKTLVENTSVTFNDYITNQIAKLANDADVLNDALISRSRTVGGDFARMIYAYASESLKERIAAECGGLSSAVSQKMDEVFAEFTEEAPHPFMPSPSIIKAADLFAEQGKLNVTLMMNTLKRGQMASFVAQFSRFTQLPVAIVIPMLQQKSGQSLAIASKANGISREEFLVIFNFTRKIMGENYLSAVEVSKTMRFFDRVSPDVAKRLMRKSKH